MVLSTGSKGRFKASGREFEVTATTSTTSTLRFRGEKETHELDDVEIRANAIQIEDFTRHD